MKDANETKGTKDTKDTTDTTARWVSILLAGGQSRRMGTSKARLHVDNKRVIEYLAGIVKPFSRQVVVVSTHEDESFLQQLFEKDKDIHVVKDHNLVKGEGPLAGMYTGMITLQSDWYFIGACDMVNLNTDYLQGLHKLCASTCLSGSDSSSLTIDAYVPINEHKVHPLAGIYRDQSRMIQSLLDQGKRRVVDLLQEINTYYIKEQEWKKWTNASDPFFNMNDPQDYQEWLLRRENHHG
jgi:molybdopterin-guanine dinucleotide biosynthesis protein A